MVQTVLLHPVYVIAMYLSPKYHDLDYEIGNELEVHERQMHPACSGHPQVQQLHLHQGPQDNDPNVLLEDNTTVHQTHKKAGIICVSTEGTCSGDFVLILIIFKTHNQEQDDDRQPNNDWINLQVTERQHPHSVQE